MSEDLERDPFDSLAPTEADMLPPGSVISDGGGRRWRRVPSYDGPFVRPAPPWWDGNEELSTADLYKDGRAYWLEKVGGESVCVASDDEPHYLIDDDGDLWKRTEEWSEGKAVYAVAYMTERAEPGTLADIDHRYGVKRKLYERP